MRQKSVWQSNVTKVECPLRLLEKRYGLFVCVHSHKDDGIFSLRKWGVNVWQSKQRKGNAWLTKEQGGQSHEIKWNSFTEKLKKMYGSWHMEKMGKKNVRQSIQNKNELHCSLRSNWEAIQDICVTFTQRKVRQFRFHWRENVWLSTQPRGMKEQGRLQFQKQ